MKKIVSIVLAMTMCMGMLGIAFADELVFSDVEKNSALGESIYKLADAGIINGYEDGTFKAENHLTRAELCKMINITFEFKIASDNTFYDVSPKDWFYIQVLYAINRGYIKGFEDNTFRGDDNVSREQVCVILDRILGLKSEDKPEITDEVSDWAQESVERMIANGYMPIEEGETFRATEDITRGELAETLKFFVKEKEVKPDDTNKDETDKDDTGKDETGKDNTGNTGSGNTGGNTDDGDSGYVIIDNGNTSSGDDPSQGDEPGGNDNPEGPDNPDGPGEEDEPQGPPEPTPEEIEASQQACIDLEIALADMELIEFAGDAAEIIEIVKADIDKTLIAAEEEGILVTQKYVRTTYADDILTIKEKVTSMSLEDKEAFKTEILKMNTATLMALINYFNINMEFFN